MAIDGDRWGRIGPSEGDLPATVQVSLAAWNARAGRRVRRQGDGCQREVFRKAEERGAGKQRRKKARHRKTQIPTPEKGKYARKSEEEEEEEK